LRPRRASSKVQRARIIMQTAASAPSIWSLMLQRSTQRSKLRVLLNGVLEDLYDTVPVQQQQQQRIREAASFDHQTSWSSSKLTSVRRTTASSRSSHTTSRGSSITEAPTSTASHVRRTPPMASSAPSMAEQQLQLGEKLSWLEAKQPVVTLSTQKSSAEPADSDPSSSRTTTGSTENAQAEAAPTAELLPDASMYVAETPSTSSVMASSLQPTQRDTKQSGVVMREVPEEATSPRSGSHTSVASTDPEPAAQDETRAAAPDTATALSQHSSSPMSTGVDPPVQCCDAIASDGFELKWHRICFECHGELSGTAYMLNDRSYCSEKHRLVASRREYFASRSKPGISRSQSDEEQLRGRPPRTVITPSPSSGLLATYKTWM